MSVTKADVEAALARVTLPDGKSLMAHDLVRALTVEGDKVRFVIEAPSADVAKQMGPLRDAAEKVVSDLPGVAQATVALTAHGPAPKPSAPPSLKIGGHPKPQEGPTGQRRRGQVHRQLKPCRGPGAGRAQGGPVGCRHLRAVTAPHDGH